MRIKLTKKNVETLQPGDKPYEVYDTDLRGFLLRVQPSGVRRYYVRYRVGGGRTGKFARYVIGDAGKLTPDEARRYAKGKLADVERGEDPQADRRRARVELLTIGSFIEGDYKRDVLTKHKSGAATLARLRNCFERDFWGRPLNDATLSTLMRNWYREQTRPDKKPPKSLATVFRDMGALSAVFSHGVEESLLEYNPMLAPMRKERKRLGREKKNIDNERVRYLSSEEEQRLMAALDAREEGLRRGRDSHNRWLVERGHEERLDLKAVEFADYLKPMVLLSLATGIRRGELFSLEWADLDLEHGNLHIRKEVSKTGYPRDVPLNADILPVVKKWRGQTAGGGLVFQSEVTGGRFDNVGSAWEKLLEDAKIENFHWHDLRHDFASKLVMAGNDLNRVRDLLGHRDLKMTVRYSHLAPQGLRSAVDTLVRR